MPYKEKEIVKVKYDIGDVADMCGVATSKIRFYEEEWGLLTKRNKKGNRTYSPAEVAKWKVVLKASKTKKFTVIGLYEIFKTGTITM
jgi:DNA-binding transcriptional MerR regulator